MPNDFNADLLGQVLGQTFEDAAFIFAEPSESAPDWEEPRLEVSMKFAGPGSEGLLVLTAGRSFACKLAANLLGVDEDDPELDSKADGALSELLNIYAGTLVVELFGDDVVCQLGIPQAVTLQLDEPATNEEAACCSISMVTDEGDRIDARAYSS